jgi:hypothetical protein
MIIKKKLIIITYLIFSLLASAQEKKIDLGKALIEIEEGNFKGLLLNNKLIEDYLIEYENEAEIRGLKLHPYIQTLNFIVVEPESSIPRQLTESNLGKVDNERKLILLSRICLIDNTILKATLFRELSHYLGVPYEAEGAGIMSLNKPEGYSYAWLADCNDNDIKQFEYDAIFAALKKHIIKK